MNVLCAPQAFKGSLTALAAAQAMAEGVRQALPQATVTIAPMADGGDDTLDVLVSATRGRYFTAHVQDALGRAISARWGALGDGETAVVEMAQASGIRLLKTEELDPLRTTTFGTGQLITAALKASYRKILVGIGGSATVDGGTGAVAALGGRFLDSSGAPLPPGGGALARLHRIDLSALDVRLAQTAISVACDVDIPLCGPRGAWTFAPQKGATPQMAKELAAAMEHFSAVVAAQAGVDLRAMPLAGPAGGLAGGLHALCRAKLLHGSKLVLGVTGLDKRIAQADLVITGEGAFDRTTLSGKGPREVAACAKRAGVPVIVVAGHVATDLPDLAGLGIVGAEPLLAHAPSLEYATAHAAAIITKATAAALTKRYQGGAPGWKASRV
ncbi:MAG: glycerate kinase [Chloroflexi bacterium]|nr:glycerate kinase [Chloroflexota bacterium]